MPRKKVKTNAEIIDSIPELLENEQYVIEDRTVVRKEKAQQKESEPVPEPEPGTLDIELEDEEPESEPGYSPNSIAAMIYGQGEEPIENQYCSVAIRRNPDSLNDGFLNPCHAVLTLPPMRNVELSADRSDIEETVRNLHGGGHYFFQIYFNNRLSHSWKVSLADSPQQIAAARAAAAGEPVPAPTPEPSPPPEPPRDPFDSFLDNLEKQKR